LDGKIWALKANSLTSPLVVTVTVQGDTGFAKKGRNVGKLLTARPRARDRLLLAAMTVVRRKVR